ncbi:MAG: hypothetical protein ACK56I_30495 [bacterium]
MLTLPCLQKNDVAAIPGRDAGRQTDRPAMRRAKGPMAVCGMRCRRVPAARTALTGVGKGCSPLRA